MADERQHRVLTTLANALAGGVCGLGFYLLVWFVLFYITHLRRDGGTDALDHWEWFLQWRVVVWFICGGALAGLTLRSRFFRSLERAILAMLRG